MFVEVLAAQGGDKLAVDEVLNLNEFLFHGAGPVYTLVIRGESVEARPLRRDARRIQRGRPGYNSSRNTRSQLSRRIFSICSSLKPRSSNLRVRLRA